MQIQALLEQRAEINERLNLIPYDGSIEIKEEIEKILNKNDKPVNIVIELYLYCMKAQIFNDGNKRASVIFANQFLIYPL